MPVNTQFGLTQGDLVRTIAGLVKNSDGTRIDCSGATATFSMWNAKTKALKITASAASVALTSPAQTDQNGDTYYEASYSPSAGDVDTAGIYYGHFELSFPGGPLHVPSPRKTKIVIVPEVG